MCVLRINIPVGCTTELSIAGLQFLQQLFAKYDEVSGYTGHLRTKHRSGL